MSTSKHIVILPANAQGHLIPALTFAKLIAARKPDFTITIATTPLNTQFIRSKILAPTSDDSSKTTPPLPSSSTLHSNIRLAELPFNSSDHGLTPNMENVDSTTDPQAILLMLAILQTLGAPFRSLISSIIDEDGHPPLCIISDMCYGWAVEVAKSHKIPSITLNTAGAFSSAAWWQSLTHPPTKDSNHFKLTGMPEKYQFQSSNPPPFFRDTDAGTYILQGQLSLSMGSDGWLCNTVEEIEGIGLEMLRKYIKAPVWAIGPFLPSRMLGHNSSSTSRLKIHGQHGLKDYGASPNKCIEWLDTHPQGSVIYISFGSLFSISTSQMMELAKGLQESGHPFIWAINPPFGFNRNEVFKAEWLPNNFEEQVQKTGQGLLVHGWAPQLEILSHKSTGAFLSHCGWSSVLESLSQGVPIIGWPMTGEHRYIAWFFQEEMGVCVEMASGLEHVIVGEEVKKIIDSVLNKSNREGGEMKKKMVQIAEKMRAAVREDEGGHVRGSSLKAMDDFINTLTRLNN